MRRHWRIGWLWVLALGGMVHIQAAEEAGVPRKYVVDYPAAEQFCPPVETFFDEVTRTFEVVRGRRFTHQANGGYGLPVVEKVGDRHLLHLGADVAWHRVGTPVYAVAAGVVRASEGPELRSSRRDRPRSDTPGPGSARGLVWGNLITIEHRLPDGSYLTSVYGHLGPKRLVAVGDAVRVGQPIGSVGRKHARVNGGYTPHLHFAIRRGRLAEPGCTLLTITVDGQVHPIRLLQVGEEEIEIELPGVTGGRSVTSINVAGQPYPVTVRDGKHFVPARMLWVVKGRPGFRIVGYGLTVDDWPDPVALLRQFGADRFAPVVGTRRVP